MHHLLTRVIQARRDKAGTEETRQCCTAAPLSFLGTFDGGYRGGLNGSKDSSSSSTEGVACRLKLAVRHGPSFPCHKLPITRCIAVFAFGFAGAGRKRGYNPKAATSAEPCVMVKSERVHCTDEPRHVSLSQLHTQTAGSG